LCSKLSLSFKTTSCFTNLAYHWIWIAWSKLIRTSKGLLYIQQI
jgi:hypothetical protein